MSDHLIFGSFLALVLHGILVFGISFSIEKAPATPPTLEITLAQYPDKDNPDEADFLAQHNQQASGKTEEKRELTTDQQAEFADTKAQEAKPQAAQAKLVKTEQQKQLNLVSAAGKQQNQESKEQGQDHKDQEYIAFNAEIASLKARLDRQKQAYARRPRTRTLSSVATKRSDDAAYLLHWREQVEAFGNRHYPEEARNKEIYGDVRLIVLLQADGTIKDASIMQSSGYRILDDAALQIVRQASPFDPFPGSIRKDTDILEIIRTWRFVKGDTLTSSH